MRTVFFVALLALAGLSYQITAQEMIAATNRARVKPVYFADLIRAQYTSKGIKGTSNDPNCYAEAESVMRSRAPIAAYKESIVADCAAKAHSDWMLSTKIFSHTGVSGSNPKARLEMYGTWPSAAFGYNENIAYNSSPSVTADAFTIQFLADCGVASRGHRNNILSTTVDQYGCGHSGIYITCVGTKAINLKATAAQLTSFGLSQQVNGAGFAGF